MQTNNNYVCDVYNGDVGRMTGIDLVEQTLAVIIDGRSAIYDWGRPTN